MISVQQKGGGRELQKRKGCERLWGRTSAEAMLWLLSAGKSGITTILRVRSERWLTDLSVCCPTDWKFNRRRKMVRPGRWVSRFYSSSSKICILLSASPDWL
jgi:hypothetical protein